MKQQWPKQIITLLAIIITVLATWATTTGVFTTEGPGTYSYTSIRGKVVSIYGKGLYKDMSAEVAPQGIAQDYVTLLFGIPLLLSLFMARKGSARGRYLLAGTLGYFLVTYLFYTVMGMYNRMFLVYVALMGASFYSFLLTLLSFETKRLETIFNPLTPRKTTGGFLILTSISIAMLWLGIVVPPLLNGTIVPVQVEHYTTLIVQALDLGILLPAGFICGVLWIKKRPLGLLLAPVYFVFLSVLMTALNAKVIAMAVLGYPVVPVIFIIPTFNLLTIFSATVLLKNMQEPSSSTKISTHEKQVLV